MAIKTTEELLNAIKERVGEDSSDEALEFIENVSDTLNDLNSKASKEQDWERKYNENDSAWRKKYRERFFSGNNNNENNDNDFDDDEPDNKGKRLTFESLFKEE